MDTSKAHHLWKEQCEAANTIKSRFGVTAAFDYLVGEKLLNFAEHAAEHGDFARELPQFVSQVRRLFTPEQLRIHLAQIERRRAEAETDLEEGGSEEEDDIFPESPAATAARNQRFKLVKELLTAPALGTS